MPNTDRENFLSWVREIDTPTHGDLLWLKLFFGDHNVFHVSHKFRPIISHLADWWFHERAWSVLDVREQTQAIYIKSSPAVWRASVSNARRPPGVLPYSPRLLVISWDHNTACRGTEGALKRILGGERSKLVLVRD